MGCERYDNYGHGELLSWVEGNDVFLKARVYEKVVTEQDSSSSEGDEPAGNAAGTVEERAVDLTAFDDVEVELVKVSLGTRTDIETAIDQTEDNCLVVHCPHTLESGEYALEIRMMKDGLQARSFDIQFAVVQTDCEAQTTFEVIDGCRSASLRVTLQVVSQAMVRGKSAYELWKELPGNEDKGLQDFIDEVLDFHRRGDEINAEEAARVAAENARVLAEQGRARAEDERASAERARIIAETNRENAEAKRERDTAAAVAAADAATAGTERVNASLSGTVLTVTDRTGQSESVDVRVHMMLFEVDNDMQLSVTQTEGSEIPFVLEDGYLTIGDNEN